MAYKRKTKDVICRKCGKPGRVPVDSALRVVCCARRDHKGFYCTGSFKLN